MFADLRLAAETRILSVQVEFYKTIIRRVKKKKSVSGLMRPGSEETKHLPYTNGSKIDKEDRDTRSIMI